jgi:hypothetical protein
MPHYPVPQAAGMAQKMQRQARTQNGAKLM